MRCNSKEKFKVSGIQVEEFRVWLQDCCLRALQFSSFLFKIYQNLLKERIAKNLDWDLLLSCKKSNKVLEYFFFEFWHSIKINQQEDERLVDGGCRRVLFFREVVKKTEHQIDWSCSHADWAHVSAACFEGGNYLVWISCLRVFNQLRPYSPDIHDESHSNLLLCQRWYFDIFANYLQTQLEDMVKSFRVDECFSSARCLAHNIKDITHYDQIILGVHAMPSQMVCQHLKAILLSEAD